MNLPQQVLRVVLCPTYLAARSLAARGPWRLAVGGKKQEVSKQGILHNSSSVNLQREH